MSSTPSFLPFALPEIGEEEIAEVVDTLRSGWVTTGPKAKRFEQDFARFLGDEGLHCIAVNSATAGLHLALEAIGIGPGDEVITTTHTFTATAEVVRYLGADVRLVDIDPATLNIDPALIEAAITPRTKAIIPVHYAGLACDMDAIHAIAARHGLKVVEDAAHALPTSYKGRLIGTLDSAATVFSFYANKTITTGEGGMLVTRDEQLAARAKVMRLHGINRDAFDRFTAKVPSWYYEIVAPGFKYNLTDIAAALGLHQLKKAQAFADARRAVVERYNEGLKDLPVILPPAALPGDQHPWHLYVLRLQPSAKVKAPTSTASPPPAPLGGTASSGAAQRSQNRDALIDALFQAGIGVSVHYIPLHQHPYWKERYGLRAEQFPHSQTAYEQMLSLPLYSRMTLADADRVIAALRQHLG